MELLTLDQNFKPEALIEQYESLIWSERYFKNGDFQLESVDVSRMMTQLPRGKVVSLRESTVPMIVERYHIHNPPDDAPTITVTGRSFETVLDRRAAVLAIDALMGRDSWKITANSPSDAAFKLMRLVLGDVAKAGLPAVTPAASPLDAIPQIQIVTPSDYVESTDNTYEFKVADLYSSVMELLAVNRRGLKAVRPDPLSAKNTVDLEIYNGVDLTNHTVFDARFNQFDDASYLLSDETSKNVGYVYGPNGATLVRKNNVGPEPSGLDRRVLVVDETSEAVLNTDEVRTARGLVELYNNNAVALFDGEITESLAELYNRPSLENGYSLGDIIRLDGDYGLSTNVRVVEFIRTFDTSGYKAYPAFEVVEE